MGDLPKFPTALAAMRAADEAIGIDPRAPTPAEWINGPPPPQATLQFSLPAPDWDAETRERRERQLAEQEAERARQREHLLAELEGERPPAKPTPPARKRRWRNGEQP